jgi:LacI family transcriptional regulator
MSWLVSLLTMVRIYATISLIPLSITETFPTVHFQFMAEKRITIKQVAQEAGVSTQTVSRVLNERPDVSDTTRQRVTAIITRLGYEPSAIARSLIRGRSRTLGIVASGLEYYGPTRILVGVEQQVHALGYSLLLSLLHEPGSAEGQKIVSSLLSLRVEGIIWAVPEIDDTSAWLRDRLAQVSIPVVFTNTQPGEGFSTISMDNRLGARQAVGYLVETGCRCIGILSGPLSWWEARQRWQGWQDALQSAGLPAEERQVVHGDWTAESGGRGLEQLLERFPEMYAVFACNDQMALGVLQAANRLGRRIPLDLAVVGFDDIPEAPFFLPSLTTIRQPLNDLGASAVRELHRLIEARHSSTGQARPASLWLQTTLVPRDSTSHRIHSRSFLAALGGQVQDG